MEQKDITDGSESSAKFSRYEESCARALRTFAEFKLLMHSSTKLDPVLINEENSDSKNNYKNFRFREKKKKNYIPFSISVFCRSRGYIFILWKYYALLKTYN